MLLVLVDQQDGGVDDLSLQALAFAHGMAGGDEVHAVAIGDVPAAGPLGSAGAAKVYAVRHDALGTFSPTAWARCLVQLAERLAPAAVIAAGSERGNEVMAHVGAMLDQPMAANCTQASAGSPVTVTRVRWGGSLLEQAALHGEPALLTVAPHTVEPASTGGGEAAVEEFTPELDEADLAVRVSEQIQADSGGISLADAKVVISGGRGTGSAEGFAPIEELAELLGAAVGCSRAVTIAGWRPHTDQVGQTGTKIAPDIYIACGISGATQHMAGCKGAKAILAINTDPEASIIANADYAVIGDLHEVVPAITAEVRKARGA
ncbi:MAG TPA: electron transfer flavoprotein subunit alpha/FixB family protein [Gaiellales bacterium]|nr:electron transfer flavoprotein subunit alpha/FixB family protein [Gaiellales bacterium]